MVSRITLPNDPLNLEGYSLAGLQTAFFVKPWRLMLDAGVMHRPWSGTETVLLTHTHLDHVGALPSLIGMRAASRPSRPLQVICPDESSAALTAFLRQTEALQGVDERETMARARGMAVGEHMALGALRLDAYRGFHRIPCRAYRLSETRMRLKPELQPLTKSPAGRSELAARRRAGETVDVAQLEARLAYATDTTHRVFEHAPELLDAETLICECTFLDERVSVDHALHTTHMHMNTLEPALRVARAKRIVLMHISQRYAPREAHQLCDALSQRIGKAVFPLIPPRSWDSPRVTTGPGLP